MSATTVTNRCSDCGLDHEAQREHFPAGTIVEAVCSISNYPHGVIPCGSKGKVTSHCDDGRAWIFFDDYAEVGHTFHLIDDSVRVVELPATKAITQFDHIFEDLESPEYPATCNQCGEVGTNAGIDSYVCDEPSAPRAGECYTATSIPLATEQNQWRVVKTIPERPTSDVMLQVSDDDGIRLPWHRQELLEVIARYANGYPKATKALNNYKKQHTTLVEQQERLVETLRAAMKIVADRMSGGRMLTTREEAAEVFDKCQLVLVNIEREGEA